MDLLPHLCSHCGRLDEDGKPASGVVWLDETQPSDSSAAEQGTDGTLYWCSEVCRQVVVEGKWPSPVGPASHDEMLGWIDAEARERADRMTRRDDELRRSAAARKRELDVAVADAIGPAVAAAVAAALEAKGN